MPSLWQILDKKEDALVRRFIDPLAINPKLKFLAELKEHQ